MCLMTWSGPTGTDPKLSLEEFSGVSVVAKDPKIAKNVKNAEASAPRTAVSDGQGYELASVASSSAIPVNGAVFAAADERPAATADAAPGERAIAMDMPIDIPEQTGVEQAAASQPFPPLPVAKPIIKPVVHRSREEVCDSLAKAAHSNDLPIPFFIRLLFQESGFKPGVVSRAGAQGIAQFMPETAASMGLDNPFDPLQAIPASARLLRDLFQQFGNLGLAAAAYNAGPKRIQDWLAKKSKLPQETQGYVKIITGRPAETWKGTATGNPEMRLPARAPCQAAAGLYAANGPVRIPLPQRSPSAKTAATSVRTAAQSAASSRPSKRQQARTTTVVKTAATAKAATAHDHKGAIQLAARKLPANKTKADHGPGKLDRKATAKPAKLAMASHAK